MEDNTEKPRIIKKYPNRRLYDTYDSKYITMADLRLLINSGVEFTVVDTRNGEDITRAILLQIIAEQERGDNPVFSSDFLTQLIRGYGNSMQSLFSNYLQEGAKVFSEQQQYMQQSMNQMPMNPVDFMNKLSEQQLKMWKRWEQTVSGGNAPPKPGDDDPQDNNSR